MYRKGYQGYIGPLARWIRRSIVYHNREVDENLGQRLRNAAGMAKKRTKPLFNVTWIRTGLEWIRMGIT